jgi:uncharacterized protein YyaL (SSP411 family)
MKVCQMMTGGGGWPLTVLMTHEQKPFFTGTYFPKHSRGNRIGMIDLIPRIKNYWNENRIDIEKSAEDINKRILTEIKVVQDEELSRDILHQAYKDFKERFDKEFGGFGERPKFPSPHNLLFLLRYYNDKRETVALDMVIKTLIEMRKGGIYDQIGFGFHRYSTDREWFLPHFEKMLYDQAMLIMAFTEAYQITKNPLFKKTVAEIITYIERDMTSESGGFYSAEDADSEGEEGSFGFRLAGGACDMTVICLHQSYTS